MDGGGGVIIFCGFCLSFSCYLGAFLLGGIFGDGGFFLCLFVSLRREDGMGERGLKDEEVGRMGEAEKGGRVMLVLMRVVPKVSAG